MAGKLGKQPATEDRRDLLFRDFVTPSQLPKTPSRFGYGTSVTNWGMLANDQFGDCVPVGAAHAAMLFGESIRGTAGMASFTDDAVLADYSAVTGFDPSQTDRNGNNPTDQGTYVRDYLNYWRKTGIRDAAGGRHKIAAYVALEAGNPDELMQAAYLGLAVVIGVMFLEAGFEEFDAGRPFDTITGPTAGGHCMVATGRRALDDMGALTWAERAGMTRRWYQHQCDEAWVVVSPDEIRPSSGLNVRGFNTTALTEALEALS